MITYTRFPVSGERLGNYLFEIASLLGLSLRYNTLLILSNRFSDKQYFKNLTLYIKFDNLNNIKVDNVLKEPSFSCNLEYFDSYKDDILNKVIDIHGYLQSEKYWKLYENDIRNALIFNDDIINEVDNIIKLNNIDIENSIGISVRRGDFATDSNHVLLEKEYYENCYNKYFKGLPICFFSDDINWCQLNLNHLNSNIFYSKDLNPILLLAFMSKLNKFIIANSTFSWWGAYLSYNKDKTVIRPYKHFCGSLLNTDISDHYLENWITENY